VYVSRVSASLSAYPAASRNGIRVRALVRSRAKLNASSENIVTISVIWIRIVNISSAAVGTSTSLICLRKRGMSSSCAAT
jgi:hypothetical protein